ncbi:hypothetical protein GCM10020256_01140 [Streptomyces thermocoprophilus]
MQKVVSRDGTTIAYEKAGDGPPIVLLNGSFRDHTIFDALVPELTPYCTTYVYDRRGRGESGDAPAYEVAREIEDLEAVIEAAGGSAVVFAGSSGANLAIEAALAGAPHHQAGAARAVLPRRRLSPSPRGTSPRPCGSSWSRTAARKPSNTSSAASSD